MDTIKLFILDDHEAIRKGYAWFIKQEIDMELCGEASTIAEADQWFESHTADIAIVDISLRDENGIDFIDFMQEKNPPLKSIVVSGFNEVEYIQKSIAAGAKGYFLKDDPAEDIIQAIRSVYQGNVYYSDEVLSMCAQNTLRPYNAHEMAYLLTRREIDIFEFLGKGYRRRQIAQELGISAKTVSQHIENIKNKLNLTSTDELNELALHLNHEL